jgi:hypothetical protein
MKLDKYLSSYIAKSDLLRENVEAIWIKWILKELTFLYIFFLL